MGVHLPIYKMGMGLLPHSFGGWHLVYPPAWVHKTRAGGVPCPRRNYSFQDSRPQSSASWRKEFSSSALPAVLPLLPSSLEVARLFTIHHTESSAKERGQSAPRQTCSCGGCEGCQVDTAAPRLGTHELGLYLTHPSFTHCAPWPGLCLSPRRSLRPASSL